MHEYFIANRRIENDVVFRYAESNQHSANESLSECLENINPPSLFNEVNALDDSHNADLTLCLDSELHTEVYSKIDEVDNDTNDEATPISTEYCASSSAESTPKKKLHKNNLTPKQKRHLAKERYKTYTIAAGLVKKEEEVRKKQEMVGFRISFSGNYGSGFVLVLYE